MTLSLQMLSWRRGRFWIATLLLLALFLTTAPIALIVSTQQKEGQLLARDASLLHEFSQLSVLFKEIEGMAQPGEPWSPAAWKIRRSQYQEEISALAFTQEMPLMHEVLGRIETSFAHMCDEARSLEHLDAASAKERPRAQLLQESESALRQTLDAHRVVNMHVAILTAEASATARLLKVLIAVACLLATVLVFLIRGFRRHQGIQQRLAQSLRQSNEEVVAALSAVRKGFDAKSDAVIHAGDCLRVPLDGLIRLAASLAEADLPEEHRKRAEASLDSAFALRTVIRDVQDFALMDSGRLDFEIVEFRPTKLIEEILDSFRPRAQERSIELESLVAARLPLLVAGDVRRLRQVIEHLLNNSLDHTQEGRITLRAKEISSQSRRTELRFEIQDTGKGIAPEMRSRLFDPIPAADRIQEASGAGLGLAICKRLVNLMGGDIDVISSPDRGSTFSFTVVLENSASNSGSSTESQNAATEQVRSVANYKGTGNGDLRRAKDRRVEPRHRSNYPTLLRSKAVGVALVRIVDISRFGISVVAPMRLPVGTEVELRVDEITIRGLIRHCRRLRLNEFQAGVELLQSSGLDERGFPEAILKRQLVGRLSRF